MKDEGGNGNAESLRAAEEAESLRLRTKRFSLRVIRMFTSLPKTPAAQILGRQALRAATSVGANYRETCRARSDAEFIAKLGDCLKELDETHYWLELLAEAEILPANKLSALQAETSELLAIFTTISKNQKTRAHYN